MTGELLGSTCLITGACGGLGRHLSRAFWEAGASLCLTGRDAGALDRLVTSLEGSGGERAAEQRVCTVVADLRESHAPRRIHAAVHASLGELTVLVNNAGVQGPIGPMHQTEPDQWESTFAVNLFAPVALCRLFLPEMLSRGYGKIINLSGGGATGPRVSFAPYAASKTALVRATEILARETAGRGVDANCIAPGAMDTRMTEEVLAAGPEAAGEADYRKAQEVRERGGSRPEVAAELAVFLASHACDGISGRLISAVWDHWRDLPRLATRLAEGDVYTLRRIVPEDRGMAL